MASHSNIETYIDEKGCICSKAVDAPAHGQALPEVYRPYSLGDFTECEAILTDLLTAATAVPPVNFGLWITGPGGCGKSHFINELNFQDKWSGEVAFTQMGADHLVDVIAGKHDKPLILYEGASAADATRLEGALDKCCIVAISNERLPSPCSGRRTRFVEVVIAPLASHNTQTDCTTGSDYDSDEEYTANKTRADNTARATYGDSVFEIVETLHSSLCRDEYPPASIENLFGINMTDVQGQAMYRLWQRIYKGLRNPPEVNEVCKALVDNRVQELFNEYIGRLNGAVDTSVVHAAKFTPLDTV